MLNLVLAAPLVTTQVTEYSFVEIANLAVAVALILAAGLAVFYLFVGGISFILSGGQEDKIKQAVGTIRYAFIGLIVTFLAILAIQVVGAILDRDLIPYLSWERITVLIDRVLNALSQTGTSGGSSGIGGGLR